MITPKLYAWKGTKWVRRIEFRRDHPGFWEVRGYSTRPSRGSTIGILRLTSTRAACGHAAQCRLNAGVTFSELVLWGDGSDINIDEKEDF